MPPSPLPLPSPLLPLFQRARAVLVVGLTLAGLAVLADLGLRLSGLWSGGYRGDPGAWAHGVAQVAAWAGAGLAGLGGTAWAGGALARAYPTRGFLRWGWLQGIGAALLGVVLVTLLFLGVATRMGQDLLAAGGRPGAFGHGLDVQPFPPWVWFKHALLLSAALCVGWGIALALLGTLVWLVRLTQVGARRLRGHVAP